MKVCYFIGDELFECEVILYTNDDIDLEEFMSFFDIREEHKDFLSIYTFTIYNRRDIWEDSFSDVYDIGTVMKRAVFSLDLQFYRYFYPISKKKFWESHYIRTIPRRVFLLNIHNIKNWTPVSLYSRFKTIKLTINTLPWELDTICTREDFTSDNLEFFCNEVPNFNIRKCLCNLTEYGNYTSIENMVIKRLCIRDIISKIRSDNKNIIEKLNNIPINNNLIHCSGLYNMYEKYF